MFELLACELGKVEEFCELEFDIELKTELEFWEAGELWLEFETELEFCELGEFWADPCLEPP